MRTRNVDKEQLVKNTAIEMLVSDGFEGFSMNKLAKACDISVATLYIYYEDKTDLIIKIAREQAEHMAEITLKDFNPDLSFEAGLKQQWKNRAKFMMEHPIIGLFFEQLRNSPYQDKIFDPMIHKFKTVMGKFMDNAVKRGELMELPFEVYWSVAFAPLYTLIRFHNEGRSVGGHAFTLRNRLLWQTFDLVVKALHP